MSMVATPTREPVEATPRKAMGPARRARVLAAHDGCCAYPGCTITAGLEIDHTIALELGGADEDHNLAPLCGPHHRAKTALDAKLIAKARRLRKKADPETRKPSRMRSAPFRKAAVKRPWPKRSFKGRAK